MEKRILRFNIFMVVTAKKSCMIKDNATFIINLVLEK